MDHLIKLGDMLVKHKEKLLKWKGSIGPRIEIKILVNVIKGEGYVANPFMNTKSGVLIGMVFVIIDLMNRTCTCMIWKMS